jgi:hypothetical protein
LQLLRAEKVSSSSRKHAGDRVMSHHEPIAARAFKLPNNVA